MSTFVGMASAVAEDERGDVAHAGNAPAYVDADGSIWVDPTQVERTTRTRDEDLHFILSPAIRAAAEAAFDELRTES